VIKNGEGQRIEAKTWWIIAFQKNT